MNEVSKINFLKKQIVQAAFDSKEGHIPSAFSILDILYVLYNRVLNIDTVNPRAEWRDRFILSKGHASLGLYAILADKGFFEVNELPKFGSYNALLGGHPDCNKIPGVEASTGSLGHGFPMAIGVALGLRIKKNSARVYALIGDGECNEGTIWEAALLAVHHQLDNVTCIVDYNHSNDRALRLGDLATKFESFGWSALVVDGHDHQRLYEALTATRGDRPMAIIANTIKGRGVKFMEANPAWHHKSPSESELKEIIQELV